MVIDIRTFKNVLLSLNKELCYLGLAYVCVRFVLRYMK